MNSIVVPSPVGELCIYEEKGFISAVTFGGKVSGNAVPLLKDADRQLREYFSGTRKNFDLPLNPQGTPFQKAAWNVLQTIPYGTTVSYKQQAELMGMPTAARAVGGANRSNPIPIIIPCHRVVAANGKLGGYMGKDGTDIKKFLLNLEGIEC